MLYSVCPEYEVEEGAPFVSSRQEVPLVARKAVALTTLAFFAVLVLGLLPDRSVGVGIALYAPVPIAVRSISPQHAGVTHHILCRSMHRVFCRQSTSAWDKLPRHSSSLVYTHLVPRILEENAKSLVGKVQGDSKWDLTLCRPPYELARATLTIAPSPAS